ncbi:MAG: shikimate dehydrogenase [Gemmatimonadaceae bacterium]
MRALPGRLVLLGHPVAHSLSPLFQNAALERAKIPLRYEALDVGPAELASTLAQLRSIAGAGNVTIPHKEPAAAQCDELTPLARRAAAINTFWCTDGRLVGDNTDVGGFEAAVTSLLGAGEARRGRAVAVFGAGGAAAATLTAIERWPEAHVRVFSRSPGRARRLCGRFPSIAHAVERVEDAASGAHLVVNATPLGLADDSMPINPAALDAGAAVIDLVYRRGGTAWVRAARRIGLAATDGTIVLLEQGALAFERWFGVPPDRHAMREALSA